MSKLAPCVIVSLSFIQVQHVALAKLRADHGCSGGMSQPHVTIGGALWFKLSVYALSKASWIMVTHGCDTGQS
jgi:hypothetical protein